MDEEDALKPTSGPATFNTPSGTPNCRRRGSRISGESDSKPPLFVVRAAPKAGRFWEISDIVDTTWEMAAQRKAA